MFSSSKRMTLLGWLAALVISALPAVAQQVSGSITGIVIEQSGSAVPSAAVKLTDRETHVEREAQTDVRGAFVFAAVPPASYTLDVTATGFKRLVRDNINLPPNERLSVPKLQLELGQLSETISVTANGATIQTESSERSGLVTSEQISDLAVVNRNFSVLASLMPGVATGVTPDSTGSGTGMTFNVQGGRQTGNNFTIDGVPTSDLGAASATVDFVSMDSVQQVKVLVSNFQAEFGRKPGAAIQAVTKSGTAQFHGVAYWYQRNEYLNANNFFNNRQGVAVPRYRYITAGANIGGPIYIPGKFNRDKNKLFFFFNEEILREQQPKNIQNLTMPTLAERQGDFSNSRNVNGALIVITDPTTGKAFPGNVIPASRIYPAAQGFLKLFPQPNFFNPAIAAFNYNYQFQESVRIPKHNEIVRADYNVTPKILWYARFNNWWEQQQGYSVSAGGPAWPWISSIYQDTNHSGALSGTFLLSPSLVLELSSGFMELREADPLSQKSIDAISRTATGANIPQLYPQFNPLKLLPQATFTGIPSPPSITYDGRYPITGLDRLWTINAALTKTRQSHTMKFGAWAERALDNKGANGNFAGTYSFNNDVNNPLNTGDPYANAILGIFNSYTESTSRPAVRARSFLFESYAQDTWKVNRRLTLDLGLRFGWAQPYYNLDRQSAGFVPSAWDPAHAVQLIQPAIVNGQRVGRNPITGAISPAVLIGADAPGAGDPFNGVIYAAKDLSYPASLRDSSGLKAAPRFGFAYDPLGNGKTAIRGGFGIFYEMREQGIRQFNTYVNPPLQLNPIIYYGTMTTLAGSADAVFPSAITGFDRNWPVTRTLNFNFGVQRDIGFGTVVDVSYVAALGRHLVQGRNLNSIPAGADFLPKNLDPTTGRAAAAAFLRPFLGYNNISYYGYGGNSSYHSLQTTVNRRFSRHLQYGFAWTWSKAMNYSDQNADLVSNVVDPRIWNYGKANYDRTHIVKSSFTYDVPSRHWRNSVVRGALDSWQVSGVVTMQSGTPLGITLSTVTSVDITGTPTDSARVVMIDNPILPKDQRTFSRNFNTAAFALPAIGTFGNAPKDVIRGPGLNNWDMSLFKNFRLAKERLKMQLRGEFYNAFNHTQFTNWNVNATFNTLGQQTNALFGQATAAAPARRIQVALRLTY
jgi:hypothetical protein